MSGLQNVFFLKCATEYRLTTVWNLLIQIPQETREDYAQLVDWLPKSSTCIRRPAVRCASSAIASARTFIVPASPKHPRRQVVSRHLSRRSFDLDRVAYYFVPTGSRSSLIRL